MRKIGSLFILLLLGSSLLAQTVTFDRNYVQKYDGRYEAEIPEVQELALIMIAISDRGRKDTNMVNQRSAYYREVIEHFKPEHRAIQIVDSLLKESLIYYIFLSSNAYGFRFKGDSLEATGVYTFPAKGVGAMEITEDPIVKYRAEIEDFAKVSGFRKFYKAHAAYYQSIVDDYQKYGQIAKQKYWLESKFNYKINSYKVLTSGLIGGINATTTFEDQGFKEMLLYLPTIKQNPRLSEEHNTILNSRVIFTEIDHNYVGPLSAQYKSKIDSVFSNRELWVNASNTSTRHYPTPVKVFDEYLTWGLFILYVYDVFPNRASLLDETIAHVNAKMVAKGFPKAQAFNETLLMLYKRNPAVKIEALYAELLNWSASQK